MRIDNLSGYCIAMLGSVLLLFGNSLSADQNLKLRIDSPDECVFGDMDLIMKDFVKDSSFNYHDSRMLLEVRDELADQGVYTETLVDLAEADRQKDKISEVFTEQGLNLTLNKLKNSEYSISMCKVTGDAVKSCKDITPLAFDVMFKEHTVAEADSAQITKLYYFKRFKFTNGRVEKVAKQDPRDEVNSMPLDFRKNILTISLPKSRPDKCKLPEATSES